MNKLDVVEHDEITSGYCINLYFDENLYFENENITKENPMTPNSQPEKYSTCPLILLKGRHVFAVKANQRIEEEEGDYLQYLSKLEVVEYEDIATDYSINLYFDETPHNENEIIVREIIMTLNRQLGKNSTCTPVLCYIVQYYSLAAKATQRIVTAAAKGEKKEMKTFLSWFWSNADPVEDDIAEVIKVARRSDSWYDDTPIPEPLNNILLHIWQ